MNRRESVRNFCIIAHIDHGKSTLADRLLELTETVPKSKMKEQVLDNMDLEREKGITIKSHAITMSYRARDGRSYTLNLIDTPGHVDFTYEVSRSLAACEGAILVVDASQGVEAQTISNLYLALEQKLTIIPVLNKVDLPAAMPDETALEVAQLLHVEPEDCIRVSAKEGRNVEEVLEAVVRRIPAPEDESDLPLQALIFDSVFDQFRGVIVYVRVVRGRIRTGDPVRFFSTEKRYEVLEVGTLRLGLEPKDELTSGDVGYVIANIKVVGDAKVGDTMTNDEHPATEPLPGYRPVKPMVFSGLYPIEQESYVELKESLAKLQLNDASLTYEPETSLALGFGFRCGFLGLLHMEIVQERLSREYDVDLIATVPSVEYHVLKTNGEVVVVENPALMPPAASIEGIEEPYVKAAVVVPVEYVGNIMKLAQDRRGIFLGMEYPSPERAHITYELPLAEIVLDFYDKLKSISRGYASLDYELAGYKPAELVKMDLLLNGDPVDALSVIVHREKAYDWGRDIGLKLKELIPRQMFPIAIQAVIGGQVVARETISALRKNVIAKCYGGDITRKRKLLEKQKEGKQRMKQVGTVRIPQEAFLAVLRVER
ncbi:MAG TPA: translation elongation factor 4 [Candidatus Eisenbacteria bacterium]|jgi:GTP-binding protein LepA|nr:translation elongation factor 4 [Candidatus Eisenbacteria bacterium]